MKLFVFMVAIFIGFLTAEKPAAAATFPVPGVEIFAKSVMSKQVTAATTDKDGNFSITVPEESGIYNMFFVDQNSPPVKISAKKNILSGRIVVLTEGTTTKDPAPEKKPVPVKKTAPVKKIVKPKLP